MSRRRDLTETDKATWHYATSDVRPLKGKKRIPLEPDAELLKKKPIKAKTPILRVRAASLFDGRIDLHGMTEGGAYQSLMAFMGAETKRGSKKLLIITGKGTGLSGVLRANVPRWLDVEPLISHIRQIEIAQPNLGGDGAYLVTLKAKK